MAQNDTQVLTMKPSLNALQQLRLHHAMLFCALLGPTSKTAAMLEKAKVAGDNYHKATVGKRGHGLGPPGMSLEESLPREARDKFKEHFEKIALRPEMAEKQVQSAVLVLTKGVQHFKVEKSRTTPREFLWRRRGRSSKAQQIFW